MKKRDCFMPHITKLMMVLLRSEIADTDFDTSLFAELRDEDWNRLYSVSKSHDLAHLVGNAVLRNALIQNKEIREKFEKQVAISVYRYQFLRNDLEQIKKILNDSHIPFIALKGAVIRNWYPHPWMRTSSDIDILIHENDLTKATEMLKTNGYAQIGQTAHDVSFMSSGKMHLELHYRLIEDGQIGKSEKPLGLFWDYAKINEGSTEYSLCDEMFYYYHIAHMAKHIEEGGGCGIRPFLDLWILNHYEHIRTEGRKTLLSAGNLEKFAKVADEIAGHWFDGKEPSPLALQLEEFILSGGVYGSKENGIIIGSAKKKGKFRYLLYRIWIPYNRLIGEYPGLRGKRILQPFYEIRRWCRLFNKDTFKRSKAEWKSSSSISGDVQNRAAQMLTDLGLI